MRNNIMHCLIQCLTTLFCITIICSSNYARPLNRDMHQKTVYGSSAQVTINKNIVTKQIINTTEGDVFNREVYWLKKLEKCSFTPKLLSIDIPNNIIKMTHVGQTLTKRNVPKDWENQVELIVKELEKHYCYHNDINHKNILVHNNKLYLIDFGIATATNEDCRKLYPHLSRFKNPSVPHISNKDALYKTIYKILREPFLITR